MDTLRELAADTLIFIAAFIISTGITCGGRVPVTCDIKAAAVEARSP